jgi:hypothetical protein
MRRRTTSFLAAFISAAVGAVAVVLLSVNVRDDNERARTDERAARFALYRAAGQRAEPSRVVVGPEPSRLCIRGVDTAAVSLAEARGFPLARATVDARALARLASQSAEIERSLAARALGAAYEQRMGRRRGADGTFTQVEPETIECEGRAAVAIAALPVPAAHRVASPAEK